MANNHLKTLFTILFLVVLATSTSGSSDVQAPSRFNKLTAWSDWVDHMRNTILSSISWDSYGVNQRNYSHPSDIKLDWKNMAQLGLPEGYELDESCKTFEAFFYRTIEGHCNWPMKGEIEYGKLNTPFFRDHNDTYFQDQISKPREGPNPRLLSNLLFKKNTDKQEYEHTPILVGFVEFVIHDLVFSMASKEIIEIPIPRCDEAFDPECHGNKTMKVRRSQSMEGTGTDPSNPRMTKNGVTSWLDMSALYGSTPEVARRLRAFKSGKMLTQVGPDGKEYPPYNTAGLQMFGHHRDPSKIFMFGDPRGNQDWLLIAVQTLLLREHNRLCDIFETRFPYWDDQTIYEFARVAMSVKYQMIANTYQQAYFTEEMPRPWSDGVPLFRLWHGKNALQMNAVTSFPFWPGLVDKKPVTSSEEMTMGYRFHEILPVIVPLINQTGHTIDQCHLVETAFDSEGFMKAGLENVLRGMAMTQIPKFHTGTSDAYRNMKFNFGDPNDVRYYDLVAQTIIQERERGLPTFNQYYAKYTGKPAVKPRKTFAEFSSNLEYVKVLESLYNHPDEVDLTVGQYLDEELYPGTTVPRSQLITSLFSLFAVGVSDRFSAAYSSVKCIPFIGTQTFFTCTPSNALEYLLWTPTSFMGIKYHWFDAFWFKELNIEDQGYSALWRLITENSDVKCLQRDPLFPADPVTNPVVCSMEEFYPLSESWKFYLLTRAAFVVFLVVTFVLAWRSVKPQVAQE